MENEQTEVLEGHVVDIACLRRYPRAELFTRARQHSPECATMGHCVESGYGLVGENGIIALLDTKATPLVLDAVRKANKEGLRLRVTRRMVDEDMETTAVEIIDSDQ